MDNKILVAYTSQVDSTASVAEAIGKTLERLVKRKKPDLQSLFRLVTLIPLQIAPVFCSWGNQAYFSWGFAA